ncbi:MAG: TcpE family conjugal transfer membrane protein [Solirubrobacteraceae bacterium]
MADQMIVRSYRRVFRVDRRIYRVDRWALPVPGGVPLRGLGYFAVALVAILVLEALPVTGALVGAMTAPLRYVVAPLAIAVLAAQASPDGRPAHRVARDWLALRLRARRHSAGRRVPREGERVHWDGVVLTRSDEHSPTLRAGRIYGPASAAFAPAVRVVRNRRGLVARPVVDGAVAGIELAAGERLEVRP